VAVERRARPTRKQVEKRYDDAFDDFERTVRMNRADFFDEKKFSANDIQQEVQFETFRFGRDRAGYSEPLGSGSAALRGRS
jgi:hypothetical protein